jgi:LuxR family transcriptional regulator, maltose regulon positive regulatory protein
MSADNDGLGLLADKLEIPAPGLAISRRTRLEDLMEQATRHRVTLVTGPAGAGKTVACASWASTRPADSPLAWLTADAGDRDPVRFWRYLLAAFARARAIAAADAERLSDQAVADPAGLPPEIVRCVAIAGTRVVLVIDDVHELAGSPVLAGLDELVHHAPAGLRLVLSGRYAPGLTLAKLRVSGQLADIGPADLACTGQEADAYLTTLGVPTDAGLRSAITRQSEGWMAGLRLLSMSVRPSPGSGDGDVTARPAAGTDVHAGAGAHAGAHARAGADVGRPAAPGEGPAAGLAVDDLIVDYVCDEMLAPLPASTREFLMRTSLTELVAPDLADALTGDSGAAATLEQLGRENGLVQPAGPGRTEYRYHPMLRAVLETVLRREHPDQVPALLGRIARWHAARGEVIPAIRAAGQAGDWEFGAQVLADASPVAAPDVDWDELTEVLATFPADRRSNDGVLAAALAAAQLWRGDPDGALPHLDCAESALTRPTGAAAGDRTADDRTADDRTADRLWLAALQVMRLAAGDAELTAHWELASRAHEESRSAPEHRATGLLWLALGCAGLRRLDVQQARTALQHAGSQLTAGGLAALRERARSWEAVAHAWYGDLATATRIAAEVADSLTARSGDVAPILAVSQARAHVARDELEAASLLLDQADQAVAGVVQPAGEPAIAMLTGMVRTRIAINEGNPAGARGLVRLLMEQAAAEPGPGQAITVLDAEISLAAGEPWRARATLAEVPGPPGPDAAICQARLLMSEDDDKGALKLLEPIISGMSGGSATGRLSALLTAVVAHRRLSQAPEAAERLEEALALAEPDDQSSAFIAAGPPIRSALTVLITPASRGAGFASRILDRFDGRLPHAAAQPSGSPLTDSELAVLRFLPSHMTNQEIAESLFLSINTIKTHLSSVYRKLGVTSRRQAIAQGRRLDLL